MRIRLFLICVFLLTLTVSAAGTSAQTTATTCNGSLTTLSAEGVPNLYRLGLKYNIPWQAIQSASGITDVRRVGENQPLCIPDRYDLTTTTTTTTTTTVTTTTTADDMATDDATTEEEPYIQGDYCGAFTFGGVPIDRGSCLLELTSIQLGIIGIVETGVTCIPRTLDSIGGQEVQCSVRGDIFLTLPPVPEMTAMETTTTP